MIAKTTLKATLVSAIALTMMPAAWWCPGFAQEQTAPAPTAATAPEPLSADEMEVLVARIALYPDELIAVISAASLYPLQIVEAARYLDALRQGQEPEAEGELGRQRRSRCSTIRTSSR